MDPYHDYSSLEHWGQNVAWVIGTGPSAICFVLRTPCWPWFELGATYRQGLHFQMCGGDE